MANQFLFLVDKPCKRLGEDFTFTGGERSEVRSKEFKSHKIFVFDSKTLVRYGRILKGIMKVVREPE